MKRTKKLSLKTETVHTLSNDELQTAQGGAYYKTQYCDGGGSGNIQSTDDPNRYEYDAQIYQR